MSHDQDSGSGEHVPTCIGKVASVFRLQLAPHIVSSITAVHHWLCSFMRVLGCNDPSAEPPLVDGWKETDTGHCTGGCVEERLAVLWSTGEYYTPSVIRKPLLLGVTS